MVNVELYVAVQHANMRSCFDSNDINLLDITVLIIAEIKILMVVILLYSKNLTSIQCPRMRSSIGTQATKNLIHFLNQNFDLRPDLVHFKGGSEHWRSQN